MRIWNRKSRLNSRLHSCEEADSFSPDRSGTNPERIDVLNFNGRFPKKAEAHIEWHPCFGPNAVSGEVDVFSAER